MKSLVRTLLLALGLHSLSSATPWVSEEDFFSVQTGLSGAIFTPSPHVRPIDESNLSWSGYFYEEKDPSTLKIENASQNFLSMGAGITDSIEVAYSRESYTGATSLRPRNWLSLKHRLPVESMPMAVSAIMSTSERDYSTVMFSMGWRSFYFGAGTNFGGRRLQEINVGTLNDYGTALFGGYRLRSTTQNRLVGANTSLVEGEPDSFFGFAGGSVSLGRNIDFLYDYNGDVVSGGIRLKIDTSAFQIQYVSESDYDRLYNRNQTGVIAGAQYRF